MANEFQSDYDLLQLEISADWDTTRMAYRRLVNQWHPDRYVNRPRERSHAQHQFIELTKSFNNLRNFHRENDRMPFETLQRTKKERATPPPAKRVKPRDGDVTSASILNKRVEPQIPRSKKSPWKVWAVPGLIAIIAAVSMFIFMDLSTTNARTEEAIRILQQTEPSEFMPNEEGISAKTGRAGVVNRKGTNQIGARLGRDVFRN